MNLTILKSELAADPEEIGYSGMTDAECAASLNTVNRPRNRESMTGDEIANAIVVTEWNGLTAEQQQTVWNVIHIGTVDPFGIAAKLLVGIFGDQSDTIAALAAARVEVVSRAVELGLGWVRPGEVMEARL